MSIKYKGKTIAGIQSSKESMNLLNTKADTSMNNLDSEGEKHFINKTQVTNCALEIPQNVKVDLTAGNATVRKGSIAVFPAGFEADGKTPKFEHVVFPEDAKSGSGGVATNSRSQMARRLANGNLGLGPAYVTNNIYSGPTEPTATLSQVWYDTTSNLIKHRNSSSEAWVSGISFPLFEGAYATATGFTSINNIFNGMGYIGSTVWVDKGVKGLAPNYRNPDGTLKNNEISVQSVRTLTLSVKRINATLYVSPNSLTYGVGFTYNAARNILEHTDGSSPIAFPISGFDSDENGRITKWDPHQPVQLISIQDKAWIAAQGMPSGKCIYLTLGATNSTYTAPANGWMHQVHNANAGGVIRLFTNSLSTKNIAHTNNQLLDIFLPVRKGDVVHVQYNNLVTGDYDAFRFCYAEGEV